MFTLLLHFVVHPINRIFNKNSLLILIISLISNFSFAQVWEDTNTWDANWEKSYEIWVKNNWSYDFFSREKLPDGRSNPYYKFKLDCADVVYAMRFIFAYEHKLPFAIKDPTGGSNLITNRTTKYNGIFTTEKSRMREFLWAIFGMVGTKSLPNDTYPVAISKETIHAGGLILTVAKNHHSWSIQDILPIGVPHLIFNSTFGRWARYDLLERKSWPNPGWIFEGDQTPSGYAGIRYWRPIEYLNSPVWQVPGYSEEQYRIPLNKWENYVQQTLLIRHETADQKITRLLANSCEELKNRVPTVAETVDYLVSLNGQCMNAEDFDNYSTPSRDHRFFDSLIAVRKAYKEIYQNNQEISTQNRNYLQKIFPYIEQSTESEAFNMHEQNINSQSYCAINYGKKIDLSEAKRRLFLGYMSNNPNDNLEYRWGEYSEASRISRECPNYGTWTPNLKDAD